MWKDTTVTTANIPQQSIFYTLGNLADDLIEVLPKSPATFLHVVSKLSNPSFRIDRGYMDDMFSYITATVGEDKLKNLLDSIDDDDGLPLRGRPAIHMSIGEISDPAGLSLMIYLARHKFIDLSETPEQTKHTSIEAILHLKGEYVSQYEYRGKVLNFRTNLVSMTTDISLMP